MRSDILNSSSGKYLDKLRPTTVFEWNYISCGSPMFSHAQSSDTATATEHRSGLVFPGPDGSLYPVEMVRVGAVTAALETPLIEGTVPATDTGSTAAGLNMQMDQDTSADLGWEIVPGGAPLGNKANKFVAGVHSGYVDITFWTTQWTTYDGMSIGFRKAENFNDGHAPIVAAGTGDPVYEDFATFGIQEADKIQIATDIDNGGSGSYTDTGQTPTDSDNLQLRVILASDGSVTYKHVSNDEAGAGAIAAPTTTASFTFNDGETLIPYVWCHGSDHADSQLLIKDIKVVRNEPVDGHSVA
jgi:hypothetical protein